MTEQSVEVIPSMRREVEEARVIQGLREGAPEAAEQLFDRYGASLLTFALAWFPTDRGVAEEVVVQTFAQAARYSRQFDPQRASLLTWLYAIARRVLRDEVRVRARRKSVPATAQTPLETALDISDGQDVAAEVAARVEAQRLLMFLVGELSPLEYEVLVLSSLQQLSLREIGHIVGRSERAVPSLLHRAKQKARERLASYER